MATYSEYRKTMVQRFWTYQHDTFPEWEDYFERPFQPDGRPPVFIKQAADCNVIIKPDGVGLKRDLLLDEIPPNTPEEDEIIVAGDFNNWNPNSQWAMQKDSSGRYSITIPRPQKRDFLEFKVTRGDLANAEADEFGDDIPTRKIQFGQKDTLELDVKGWIDKPRDIKDRVTFIIENIPDDTPGFDNSRGMSLDVHSFCYRGMACRNQCPGA